MVANCVIRGNVAGEGAGAIAGGGGIWACSGIWVPGSVCDALIENSVIENNSTIAHGGGLNIGNRTVVRNCLIRFNSAEPGIKYGGGVTVGGTNVLVINSTIVSNRCPERAGGGGRVYGLPDQRGPELYCGQQRAGQYLGLCQSCLQQFRVFLLCAD